MAPSRKYRLFYKDELLMVGSYRAIQPAYDMLVKFCDLRKIPFSDVVVVLDLGQGGKK